MKIPAHATNQTHHTDQSSAQARLMPNMSPIQRKAYEAIQQYNDQTVQRAEDELEEPAAMKMAPGNQLPVQRAEDELEEPVSMKAAPGTAPVQRMEDNSNSTGMPDTVKSQMEGAFNTDFSDVKVHTESAQAKNIGALAYTQGTDVHFAPGQFKPESTSGKSLIGHELTHVVQQREGKVQPTTEVGGMPVNDDVSLESEADAMGNKAASFGG